MNILYFQLMKFSDKGRVLHVFFKFKTSSLIKFPRTEEIFSRWNLIRKMLFHLFSCFSSHMLSMYFHSYFYMSVKLLGQQGSQTNLRNYTETLFKALSKNIPQQRQEICIANQLVFIGKLICPAVWLTCHMSICHFSPSFL